MEKGSHQSLLLLRYIMYGDPVSFLDFALWWSDLFLFPENIMLPKNENYFLISVRKSTWLSS